MEKICNTCGKLKKLESFGVNKAMKNGIENRCKICKNAYQRGYVKKKPKPIPVKGPTLTGLNKLDWCKTYSFLKKLGYDIQGDIHEQFTKKYGLPYKERPIKNKIQFLPTDCSEGFDMANPLTEQ